MTRLPEDFVFSQSSLQTYVDCQRRFELRYLLRQRWPAPEVADWHEHEVRMRHGKRFHELVHQHLIGIPVGLIEKHISDPVLQGWFATYLTNGLTDIPEKRYTERTLTAQLGNHTLLAQFDLVAIGADRALIIDWKTSERLPREPWLRQRLQTRVYPYVLAQAGHMFNQGQAIDPEAITMIYWYADHDGQRLTFPYRRAQYEADAADLTQLVQDIEATEHFPLTPDVGKCRFCVYRSLCDRGTQAGQLDDWEASGEDAGELTLDDLTLDLDQIGEIAF